MSALLRARCAFAEALAALTPPPTFPMTTRAVWDEYQVDGRQLAAMVSSGEITRTGEGRATVYHGVQAAVAARRAA